MKREAKVLPFGEDLGEATVIRHFKKSRVRLLLSPIGTTYFQAGAISITLVLICCESKKISWLK